MSKTKDEAPASGANLTQAPADDSPPNPASAPRKSNGRAWMGTAVGIGSAAIVAALLYTGRNKG